MTEPCRVCGLPLTVGELGCISRVRPHAPFHASVIGDDIPGGFVQENFGNVPETFYSKKAMLIRAKELGLEPMVRHVDGDQHVARWV